MCPKLFSSRLNTSASIGVLFLRLVAGSAFMLHGWPKIQHAFNWMGPESPIPSFFQALAAISEFGGGLAWILGLLTPLASLGLISTMTVAVYFHASKGDPFVSMGGPSFEPALVYLAVAILFLLAGPGKFSLDAYFCGKNQKTEEAK